MRDVTPSVPQRGSVGSSCGGDTSTKSIAGAIIMLHHPLLEATLRYRVAVSTSQ